MASVEFTIRPYRDEDQDQVIELWMATGLYAPYNNPLEDIRRKIATQPELFLVGLVGDRVAATCMAGYEGHRGWINYLGVHPDHRRKGYASVIMARAEELLRKLGCPKINLQVRETNRAAVGFYTRIGFSDDRVISFGKRLKDDPPWEGK